MVNQPRTTKERHGELSRKSLIDGETLTPEERDEIADYHAQIREEMEARRTEIAST